MPRVGLKFCGGCNPSIDRAMVFQKLRELSPDLSFARIEEADLDALIFICGCSTACPAEELGFADDPRAIVVAGEMLDGRPVPEGDLAHAIVEKLRHLACRPAL